MGSRPVLLWKMILAAAALNGRKACAQRADARVREIGKQALAGPFAGMEASLVEVSYPPGERSAEHRHPGFIVGYVLEGQIRFPINHETPRRSENGRDVLRTYGHAPFHIRECGACHARQDPRLHGCAAGASVVEGK